MKFFTIIALNFLVLFSLPVEPLNAANSTKTSITDTEKYRAYCKKAAKDKRIFKKFKSSPIIENVMQHVSFDLGEQYLEYINENYSHLLSLMNRFHTNDEIGRPKTYFYPFIGKFSPTNLRYIKIAGDIQYFFGDLKGKKIVEIGSGYGGQCKILHDLFEEIDTTLVDLPEPLALAKRYLKHFGIQSFKTKTMNQLDPAETFDLVISNYAFSECSSDIQQEYLDKVIANSNSGYMIYNDISDVSKLVSYSKFEMIDILNKMGFKTTILEEVPLSYKQNCLIIWNR